jgi:hypothetical protein
MVFVEVVVTMFVTTPEPLVVPVTPVRYMIVFVAGLFVAGK